MFRISTWDLSVIDLLRLILGGYRSASMSESALRVSFFGSCYCASAMLYSCPFYNIPFYMAISRLAITILIAEHGVGDFEFALAQHNLFDHCRVTIRTELLLAFLKPYYLSVPFHLPGSRNWAEGFSRICVQHDPPSLRAYHIHP